MINKKIYIVFAKKNFSIRILTSPPTAHSANDLRAKLTRHLGKNLRKQLPDIDLA